MILTDLLFESLRLSLSIKYTSDKDLYYVYNKYSFQQISKTWIISNKNKFKKKYHNTIDHIRQGFHPVYEPRPCSINYENQEIICLNYKADKVNFKLNRHNAIKLGLNLDVV